MRMRNLRANFESMTLCHVIMAFCQKNLPDGFQIKNRANLFSSTLLTHGLSQKKRQYLSLPSLIPTRGEQYMSFGFS